MILPFLKAKEKTILEIFLQKEIRFLL